MERTQPTAHTWSQIALGWVLHRGPATVTGIFRTLGNAADRHWTVYEKSFYRAAWDLATLCTALAVERCCLARGSLPGTIAGVALDFVESVPLDPYTGAELRCERLRLEIRMKACNLCGCGPSYRVRVVLRV